MEKEKRYAFGKNIYLLGSDKDGKTMSIYDHLKEINKNDQLYGWMFATDDILSDTLEDLSLYQNAYIRDVLTIYKNELENIILKAGL